MVKGQHEVDILRSIYSYHMLTVDHVTALHYATSSRRYVSSVLKSMVERKLLHCPPRPYVNLPNVYMLGIRGVRVLNDMGISAHLHPSEYRYPMVMLNHLLCTNDVLIACGKIPLRCSDHEVVDIYHDKTLKKQIDEAYKSEQITTNVVGDGLVVLKEFGETIVFWIEIDRGTEDQKKIRKKVKDILSFLEYDFERLFGYRNFVVLFITSESEARREILKTWCERELAELYAERQANHFWFASVAKDAINADMFFTPIWRVPFASDMYTLLQC